MISDGRGTALAGFFRGYGLYVALLAAYWGAAIALELEPALGTSVSGLLGLRIIPDLIAACLVARLIVAATRVRTFRDLGQELRQDLTSPALLERLAGIPLFVLGTVFTFDVYGAFKGEIPTFRDYTWDGAFADLDQVLHGATDPWIWTHALPGTELVTTVLDQVYVSWYLVLLLSVLLVATWAPLRLRSRFFLAFVLCIAFAGSLAAIYFASGGPAFYADLADDAERFAPLLQNLDGTRALSGQNALWDAFVTGSDKLYGGISAMPSMHVTLTALVALAAWRWQRALGVVAMAYTGLILVGSVHLGWHYAIDGYAGIVIAWLAWALAGLAVGAHPRGRAPWSQTV
jgi:hypothetical protein